MRVVHGNSPVHEVRVRLNNGKRIRIYLRTSDPHWREKFKAIRRLVDLLKLHDDPDIEKHIEWSRTSSVAELEIAIDSVRRNPGGGSRSTGLALRVNKLEKEVAELRRMLEQML